MFEKEKKPTWTHRILESLMTMPNDFATIAMIAGDLGVQLSDPRVGSLISSVLFSLRKYHAVDVVIDKDGIGWWFATPETDSRTKKLEVRSPVENYPVGRKSRIEPGKKQKIGWGGAHSKKRKQET